MRIGKTEITLVRGDITRQSVDAVVNAANSGLLGGGGVDGAIHAAGGPEILAECRKIRETRGPCPPGDAVITTAGRLDARHVVHTVGPVWHGGDRGEAGVLASCHEKSLALGAKQGHRTIAFPAISTGAYGYPVREAARTALDAAIRYVKAHDHYDEIRFVLFSEGDYRAFREALEARENPA